jgi:hypothetical protein
MVEIAFLYFEDCPSHEPALARLREVMAEEGVAVPVAVVRVDTEDQAEALCFYGSPTIRVNGLDIDPPVEDRPALTCRVYELVDGRISPLPSHEMIRSALRRALGT